MFPRSPLVNLLTLLIPALVILAAAPATRADELHLEDGAVLYGRLQAEGKSRYTFLEAGEKKASSVRKSDVARVVLTWDLPAFVLNDPQWSEEMVNQRLEQSFDPAWGEVEVLRSDHYIVFTNSDAGRRYLKTMEDIYERFGELFPFEEDERAPLMPVFLFKTNDQYWQYYADISGRSIDFARKSGGHAWRDYYATYYDAPGAPIHYHEGAHQLVNNRLRIGGGGSWFQEGMAVYFEGTVFPGEDPAKGMKGEIKSGRHTPFPELVALPSLLYSSDNDRNPTLGSRRYQQAGAVIKFLMEGPDKERFPELLDQVRAGRSWQEIFGQLYGLDLDGVEAAFADYYGA